MRRLLLLLVLLAPTAAGCGGNDEPSSGTSPSAIPAEEALPAPVEKKRQAIASAAQALDYDRLETLLDPKIFSYSFGEMADPIGYWRRLEREAEVPVLGDIMPTVLSGPWATQGDIYVLAERPWQASVRVDAGGATLAPESLPRAGDPAL